MENNNLPKPDNNMVWAILCTVLCCLPLGIAAIVSASKVDGYYMSGHYDAAVDAAEKAKKYSIYGAATSLVICVLYFLLMVVVAIGA